MVSSTMRVRYRVPERIVAYERADNVNTLLKDKPRQIALQESEMCVFRGGYLILDFGRETAGGLRILTGMAKDTYAGVRVRIRFGESLGETCAALVPDGTATNCHSPRDFVCYLPSYSDLSPGQTGFRFVRIDFLDPDPIAIKNIYAREERLAAEPSGRFVCDDRTVNDIYRTAAETVTLNVQNGFIWDGIKRDRLVWAGDLNPEIKALLALYGDMENIRRSLDFCRDTAPLPQWMCNMPPYSLWWMCMQREVYFATGDTGYLSENTAYFRGLLRRLDECIEPDGTLRFVPGQTREAMTFLDWSTADTPDAYAGTVSLLKLALRAAAELTSVLGTDDSASRLYRRLCAAPVPPAVRKPAAAMQFLAGETDAGNARARLTAGGAREFSTFMAYPLLKALADAGGEEDALRLMKDYFGGMLSRGATTFWEDFDVDWLENSGRIDEFTPEGKKDIHGDFGRHCYVGFRHSLCHGWAGGAVPFLTETVLGVRFAEPGGRTVSVRPRLCGLRWAEGTVPAPAGPIRVRAEQTAAGVKTEISAPPGTKILSD